MPDSPPSSLISLVLPVELRVNSDPVCLLVGVHWARTYGQHYLQSIEADQVHHTLHLFKPSQHSAMQQVNKSLQQKWAPTVVQQEGMVSSNHSGPQGSR